MKKSVLAILIFGRLALSGQTPQQAGFSFGLIAGLDVQSLNIGALNNSPDRRFVASERPGAGARIGVWGLWPLSEAMAFRPAVQVVYNACRVRFLADDGEETRRVYAFSDLELPAHFILQRKFRHLPATGHILLGGRISWNLAPAPPDAPLLLLPERLGLDIGLGAGFSRGKWTWRPEIVFSYGANNIHNFINAPYDWSVGRIFRDRLEIRLLLNR